MKLLLSFALMLCGLAVQGARFSPMQAVDLQCEYLTTPLGIDVAEPRLMWKLQSPVGGVSQSAYRVVVATYGTRGGSNPATRRSYAAPPLR